MRKLLLLLPISLFALEIEPWFCNVWEFNLTSSYTYSRYRHVHNGHPQLKSASNDHVLAFDLSVPPSPNWEIDADIEFAETPRQSMGFRSSAFQARYLWLDDVMGDPVSLTTGASIRGVSSHSLRDVSCPYHSHANFELNTSIGREWDRGFDWRVRLYGFAALGMANQGSPWARAFTTFEGNLQGAHRFGIFAEGYFGFGHRTQVPVNHFNGYASIRHQSLDAGVHYTYVFEIWGRLIFAYTRRLYAHSFPENVNFFTIQYMLPFSLF
jgi:hypothetical protein